MLMARVEDCSTLALFLWSSLNTFENVQSNWNFLWEKFLSEVLLFCYIVIQGKKLLKLISHSYTVLQIMSKRMYAEYLNCHIKKSYDFNLKPFWYIVKTLTRIECKIA